MNKIYKYFTVFKGGRRGARGEGARVRGGDGLLVFYEHPLQVGQQIFFFPAVIIPFAVDEESGGAVDAAVEAAVEIRIDLCGQSRVLHIVDQSQAIEPERFGEGLER